MLKKITAVLVVAAMLGILPDPRRVGTTSTPRPPKPSKKRIWLSNRKQKNLTAEDAEDRNNLISLLCDLCGYSFERNEVTL